MYEGCGRLVHYYKMYFSLLSLNVIFANKIFLASSSESDSMISNIFCSGKLLHYVQMSRIFNDSKYFVDMKAKFTPQKIEDDFGRLLNQTNNNPDKIKLTEFVKKHFDPPGSEFKQWNPSDWKNNPKFMNNIYDPNLRSWVGDLNSRWKDLGREISDNVLKNSSNFSLIYVPHPFIIPGGRFREFYYWDSYWIIEGLILSEMLDTAKKMLMNFLFLVENYGYVPNGGRVYYLGRSQPPMLIPMFHLYFEATKDYSFLQDNIYILEKEFNFWLDNRSTTVSIDGIKYTIFQYDVHSDVPRPESYFEDETKAQSLGSSSRTEFFSGIKSAAESGWDFSSRWLLMDGERTNNISDIHPNYLAPICLNSILGYNAKLLSEFYSLLNNKSQSEEFKGIADTINKSISRFFWDESKGIWFDFNIKHHQLQPEFYPSSLMPLWTEMYGSERDVNYIANRVLSYLKDINITSFPGGVPTSLQNSKQQWDLPNGWAPLQYFVVMGLRKLGKKDERAAALAFSLAEKWTLSCYDAYLSSSHIMYEKYDVTRFGVPGGGGEYLPQEGFGWTNGVAMKFMSLYGHQIRSSHLADPAPVILGFGLFIVSLIALVNYVFRIKCKATIDQKKTKFPEVRNIQEEENFV